MKTSLLLTCLYIISTGCVFSQAQIPVLWGLTSAGGEKGGTGTLFSINGDGSGFNKPVTFKTPFPGAGPQGKVIQAVDGKIYGMTPSGGTQNAGVIFSYDKTYGQYTDLHDFANATGQTPYGSLIQATDGKLYGMTNAGGAYNYGTIFSFNLATNSYTDLFDFSFGTGASPKCDLLQAADGRLYGLTRDGGSEGVGVLFCYNTETGVYSDLYDFKLFDDYSSSLPFWPCGNLVQDTASKLLYGMCTRGGNTDFGDVFSFDLTDNTLKDCAGFGNYITQPPIGSLVMASNHRLYGTIPSAGNDGGGMLFQYIPGTSYIFTIPVASWAGAYPYGNLVEANDGLLYGLSWGGNNKGGNLFSLKLGTLQYKELFTFSDSTGYNPPGSLIQANDGRLYGFTYAGPQGGAGTLFSYDMISDTIQTLFVFNQSSASSPWGSLTTNGNGIFYGLTQTGGNTSPYGTIFSYSTVTGNTDQLYTFKTPLGLHSSQTQLTLHSNGNLYYFGSNNIFSLSLPAAVLTNCITFSDHTASGPVGILTENKDHLLMANYLGGTAGGGIFAFNPYNNTYASVTDFYDQQKGSNPAGSVLINNDNYYGYTSWFGANNLGTIYKFDPAAHVVTDLYNFIFDGTPPLYGGLTATADGSIFGTTTSGGITNAGIIFRIDGSTGAFSKVFDFSRGLGSPPVGTLLTGSDGKLYGMTGAGGIYDGGVIFSFDPANNKYKKLADLNDTTGVFPNGGLVEYGTTVGIAPVTDVKNLVIYPNPASNILNITATGYHPQWITVFDVNGQKLSGQKFTTQVDMSKLTAGTYFIEVKGDDGTARKVFVKM